MTKEEKSKYDKQRYLIVKPIRQQQKLSWRIENAHKLIEYFKEYRNKNRCKIASEKRSWFQKTRLTRNEKSREYYKKRNRAGLRAKDSRRRSLEMKCLHPDRNEVKINEIYVRCDLLTRQLRLAHNVDHIIPIFHGGWHHELNLQILPEGVNKSKRNNPFWSHNLYKTYLDVPIELWPTWMIEKSIA